jgi:hypothetical protein
LTALKTDIPGKNVVRYTSIYLNSYIKSKLKMQEENDLSVHAFSENNFERLADLCRKVYPHGDISSGAYLEWEYKNNPEGKALIYISEKGTTVVSQYILLPKIFFINGKKITGSLSVNTITHPLYRMKGLFTGLAEKTFAACTAEKIFFTIGFPNPVSYPVIRKKKLFETCGKLPLLLKPLHPLKSLIGYFTKRKNKSGDEIELENPEEVLRNFPGAKLFDINNDAQAYASLVEKFNKRFQNVKHRSIECIRWRYVDIPQRKYQLIKFESVHDLKALGIFRTKYLYGLRCGILVDLISADEFSGENLIKVFSAIGKKNSIDLIITTMPGNSPENYQLRKNGFFQIPSVMLPQKLVMIVRKHSDECPNDVSDFQKWFLTFGDYDIF